MKKVFFLLFMIISSPAFSWEFLGEAKSYVCFRESTELPVKVTIESKGDIKITWEEHPINYNFIALKLDEYRLISGGFLLSKEYDESVEDFVQGNASNTNWIDPVIVVFYPKTRKLSYGIVGQFSFQMNCVVL